MPIGYKKSLGGGVTDPIKVELKDASDEVKKANNFLGSTNATSKSYSVYLTDIDEVQVNDIVYITTTLNLGAGYMLNKGYHKITTVKYTDPTNGSTTSNTKVNSTYKPCVCYQSVTKYTEYLGESYLV